VVRSHVVSLRIRRNSTHEPPAKITALLGADKPPIRRHHVDAVHLAKGWLSQPFLFTPRCCCLVQRFHVRAQGSFTASSRSCLRGVPSAPALGHISNSGERHWVFTVLATLFQSDRKCRKSCARNRVSSDMPGFPTIPKCLASGFC